MYQCEDLLITTSPQGRELADLVLSRVFVFFFSPPTSRSKPFFPCSVYVFNIYFLEKEKKQQIIYCELCWERDSFFFSIH